MRSAGLAWGKLELGPILHGADRSDATNHSHVFVFSSATEIHRMHVGCEDTMASTEALHSRLLRRGDRGQRKFARSLVSTDYETGVRGNVDFLENSGGHAIGGHRQQCMQWAQGQASLVWEIGRVLPIAPQLSWRRRSSSFRLRRSLQHRRPSPPR